MFVFQLPSENLLYLVLYLGTLMLHVVAMNYVLAGSIYLAVWGRGADSADVIATTLRDWMPLALGVTITLGVGPILFIQLVYQRAFYTANLLLFHRWMAILPVLIVAFYLLYLQKSRWLAERGGAARSFVSFGVVAAFLFVAWSWSENHLLSLAGQMAWTEHYGAGRMFHRTSELAPRLALWIVGAFATLAVILGWQLRGEAKTVPVRRLALLGGGGAVDAALVAIIYYVMLPEPVREELVMPPNLTVAIVGGLSLVVGAATWWKIGTTGRLAPHWLWLATAGTGTAILCATLLREFRRYVALVEVGEWATAIRATTEAAHYQGLGIFLVFLVVNVLLIAWVIRSVRRALISATDSHG